MAYFTLDELKCKCGDCESTGDEMQPEFMRYITFLRRKCNFPFIVTSAYRCPKHNASVSKGKYGAHTLGQAMDIKVKGELAIRLLRFATEYPQYFTGIGIKQNGHSRFIHIDNVKDNEKIPRPAIWSY